LSFDPSIFHRKNSDFFFPFFFFFFLFWCAFFWPEPFVPACSGEGEASAEVGSDGFGSCAVGEGVPVLAPTYDPFRTFGPPATFSFGPNINDHQDNNNNNNLHHQQINQGSLSLDASGAAFGGNLGLANTAANNSSQIIPQDLVAPLPAVFPPSQPLVNVGPIFFPQSPDDASPFSAAFPAPPPNLVTFTTGTDFAAFGTGTSATQMPEHSQNNLFRSLGGVLNDFGGGVCPAFAPPRPANQNHLWINTATNLNPTPSSSSSSASSSAHAIASVCDTRNPTALASPQSLPLPNSASFAEPDDFASANVRRSRDFNDDDFLAALVTGNFSSPSLPPHRSSPRQLSPLHYESIPHQEQAVDDANMPTRSTAVPVPRTAASERVRRASRSSAASMVDPTSPKTERASGSPAGGDAATPMAPPSTRKRIRASTAASAQGAPSRRSSTSTRSRPVKPARSSRKTTSTVDDEDVFKDGSSVVGREDDDDVLDLTGANEVPEELLKPKVDNRVKLGKFQCVICMDDVSNLTVTHCGE
jgi:hypothetical protein